MTLFPLPKSGGNPQGLARGSDGNLWFADASFDNVVGRITPQGVVTEFHTPTPNSQPMSIVAGPDGNLWFTEFAANRVGRITPAGVVTEFPIPTANSQPQQGLTVGPDGAIWFSERNAGQLGRITTGGQVTEFPAGSSQPVDIVASPDGSLWYLAQQAVLRRTPAGTVAGFGVPLGYSASGLGVDSRGNIWDGELKVEDVPGERALLVRRSPEGDVKTFLLHNPGGISSIIEGPDGAIWFAEPTYDRIGRLAPDGTITEIAAPSPMTLAVGPDGNIWFTTGPNNQIGRLHIR